MEVGGGGAALLSASKSLKHHSGVALPGPGNTDVPAPLSHGGYETPQILPSPRCLRAECFPGEEPLVFSVTRRVPGTEDMLRSGQEGRWAGA